VALRLECAIRKCPRRKKASMVAALSQRQ
jgi:hypothetical protein